MCNYRLEVDCDSPVFKPMTSEDIWDSDPQKFNITYVEFEEDGIEFITSKTAKNKYMPSPLTKFVYPYWTPTEIQKLYNEVDRADFAYFVNLPRKGQYDFTQGGLKAFNNPF